MHTNTQTSNTKVKSLLYRISNKYQSYKKYNTLTLNNKQECRGRGNIASCCLVALTSRKVELSAFPENSEVLTSIF